MNFLYLLLISLLLWSSKSSFNNPKCKGARYLCGSYNADKVCVNISDSRGKVHLLNPCPANEYCPYNLSTTARNITCASVAVAGLSTLPGQPCNKNSDCLSLSCVQGICKGNTTTCTNHSDCDPSYFCNNTGYCIAQVAFGENCTSSYECTNNCACSLGKCAYYYSLDNGIASDNAEACASGYVSNNLCAESRRSMFPGIPCSSDSDCKLVNSTGDVVGYSECACGYNGGGYSYCALSEGDDEFIQIINSFQYILLKSFYCHTMLRFGPCTDLYQEEYQEYVKAKMKFEMYPKLVFNDPCIKKIYTSSYWDLGTEKLNLGFAVLLIYLIGVLLE